MKYSNIGLDDYSNNLNKSLFSQDISFVPDEAKIEENFKKGLITEEVYNRAKEILGKGKKCEE
jgi:hypothetical protein